MKLIVISSVIAAFLISLTFAGQKGKEQPPETIAGLLQQLQGDDTFLADAAADRIAAFGNAATEPLTALLKTGGRDARAGALKALALIKDPRSVEPVIGLLKQLQPTPQQSDTFADEYLRHEAIRTLGELGDKSAVPLLDQAAANGSPHDQIRATISLIKLGEESFKTKLVDFTRHSSAELRTLAIKGLGEIGGDWTIEVLTNAQSDSEWFVRDSAAEALGIIATPRSRTVLKQFLSDPNPWVKETARHYLAR